MTIEEFRKFQLEYFKKANARKEQRLNAQDDTPWQFCVVEEMCIDLFERMKKLEESLEAANEKVAEMEMFLSASDSEQPA